MYALALAALAISPAQPPAQSHDEQNPLYKKLLAEGLDVGGKERVKFPPPTMPDGLDGAKQTAVINKLIEGSYTYQQFTRDAVVTPQLLKVTDVPGASDKSTVRRVDVWFVAYGDFKKLQDDKFLDQLTNSNKGAGGSGRELKPEELKQRGITPPAEKDKRETYGMVEFDFLEKVRLKATGHAVWSRTGESVVAAAEIDPRFLSDKEFPNQWRPLKKVGGKEQAGDPQPWSGAGMYLKITKLQEPAGAVFVEQHVIFAEPTGWFEGGNQLRSKLPLAVQDNVRSMRKEFAK